MAKITYTRYSCPQCHADLGTEGMVSITITSPFVTCPVCGKTTINRGWREFCSMSNKDRLFNFLYFTLVIPIALALGLHTLRSRGIFPQMENSTITVLFAVSFGIFTLIWLSAVANSINRTNDPKYLARLIVHRLISEERLNAMPQKLVEDAKAEIPTILMQMILENG